MISKKAFVIEHYSTLILSNETIIHYDTSAIRLFLTSVSLKHEPKVSDVITLVKKTFFGRVSYEILHTEWYKIYITHLISMSRVIKFETSSYLVTSNLIYNHI